MITVELLKKLSPTANLKIITDLSLILDEQFAKYGINTRLRICHFLAQAAHESAGFRTLEEYASGQAYEGRKDLGNNVTGDGRKYKGRGIFQITGRANYRTYGQKIGVDLENQPELAAVAINSVKTACEYWNSKKLSDFADKDDVLTITKRINGGTNGLDDRKKYLLKAKSIITTVPEMSTVKSPEAAPAPPADPFNQVILQIGSSGEEVKQAQLKLKIPADGKYGPQTEVAVKRFQEANGLTITGRIDAKTAMKLFA